MRRSGFSLVELLVTLAIVAILAAVIFPALMAAKARANQTQCASNMRQVVMALNSYADDYEGRLPGLSLFGDLVDGRYAWSSSKMSPIGKGALWKYVRTKQVFVCPVDLQHRKPGNISDPWALGGFNYTYTINSYMTLANVDRAMAEYMGPRVTKSKNPSRTILLVDENTDPDKYFCTVNDAHFASGDKTCDRHPGTSNKAGAGSAHAQGIANVCYLDGHIGTVPGLLGWSEPNGQAIFWR